MSIKAISNSFNIVFWYYQMDKFIQDQVELMMYMVDLQSLIEVLEIEKRKKIRNKHVLKQTEKHSNKQTSKIRLIVLKTDDDACCTCF